MSLCPSTFLPSKSHLTILLFYWRLWALSFPTDFMVPVAGLALRNKKVFKGEPVLLAALWLRPIATPSFYKSESVAQACGSVGEGSLELSIFLCCLHKSSHSFSVSPERKEWWLVACCVMLWRCSESQNLAQVKLVVHFSPEKLRHLVNCEDLEPVEKCSWSCGWFRGCPGTERVEKGDLLAQRT